MFEDVLAQAILDFRYNATLMSHHNRNACTTCISDSQPLVASATIYFSNIRSNEATGRMKYNNFKTRQCMSRK